MEKSGIWKTRPFAERCEKTGQATMCVRWVDTKKRSTKEMWLGVGLRPGILRRRIKEKMIYFAEAPPLEAIKLILSRGLPGRCAGEIRR